MATREEDLYAEDYYAWTRDQAAALRRLAKERWNGPLDLDHLAEEVEDLGSEVRSAVRSQLRRLMEHLLKLEHARAAEPASRLDAHRRQRPRRDRRPYDAHDPPRCRGRPAAPLHPGPPGSGACA